MLVQERKRPFIEFPHVLIDRSMGAILEDVQFRVRDGPGQRLGKAHRGDLIKPTKGDERWGRDPGQLRFGIMTDDCLGLMQEGVDWLHRSAAHDSVHIGLTLDVWTLCAPQFEV